MASIKEECLIIPEYVLNHQKKNILKPKYIPIFNPSCVESKYTKFIPLKRKKVTNPENVIAIRSNKSITHLGK